MSVKEKIKERKAERAERLDIARAEMAINKAKRQAFVNGIKEKNGEIKEGIRQAKFERNLNKLNKTLNRGIEIAKAEQIKLKEIEEKKAQKIIDATVEVLAGDDPDDIIIEVGKEVK